VQLDPQQLFEESTVHVVGQQLRRVIEEGHTRLVVNFGGVRYLSSEVLGIPAGLHKKVEQARRRIQLCGLDPLLREMVQITHLG
jgi:anti-anti-sigma factor